MLTLAQSSGGRILLHVLCVMRDGAWGWHWQGIRRELTPNRNIQQTL